MTDDPGEIGRDALSLDCFPRSSNYDPAWIIGSEMGPNVLWLTEFLTQAMTLRPRMRILDLGCGKALSSIFLAREFDVEVWATDLWVCKEDNARRIAEAGLQTRIHPITADARDLSFQHGFFDAVVSIDAFEYFGMETSFLPSLLRFVKPGGHIGAVNAGVLHEIETLPPEWPDDFANFHSPAWWRNHWSAVPGFQVDRADNMVGGRDLWLKWNKVTGQTDDAWLTGDAGQNLGFNRIVGRQIAAA